MTNHFTPSLSKAQWLSLPSDVRVKIRAAFQIPRSEGAHVQIGGPESTFSTSDGHSNQDLAVITVEKLQQHLNSTETDFFTLFDALVGSMKGADVAEVKSEAEIILEKWKSTLLQVKAEAVLKDREEELYTIIRALIPNSASPHEKTPEVSPAPRRAGRPKKSETGEDGREEN